MCVYVCIQYVCECVCRGLGEELTVSDHQDTSRGRAGEARGNQLILVITCSTLVC